jgi:diaminohydroxyphosphoribosylaminopyrimidine deaminase/5-amino-6-(5-phosphoribosylamino)uracil reductase
MSASRFMRLALDAAERVRGTTSPNPGVGAVVVRDGTVVATGATHPYGGPHAEADALARCDARGADLYVTLEPCSAFPGKRTPPCSGALIAAGVRRVVVALADPDTNVRGRGVALLREAGIQVELGDGAEEATEQLRPYLKHRVTGLPYVTAKFAASLDGMIAAPGLRWLTGERARARAHEDRARADAIMVGSGTVIADDPALTARPGGVTAERQPLRVVADAAGRVEPSARLFREPGRVLVATTTQSSAAWRAAIVSAGATVIECERAEAGVNLDQLLQALGQRGVLSLIVEGGAQLLRSCLGGGHADEVHAYLAPMLIGPGGLPVLGRAVTAPVPLRLESVVIEPLDPDVLVRGYTGTWAP